MLNYHLLVMLGDEIAMLITVHGEFLGDVP